MYHAFQKMGLISERNHDPYIRKDTITDRNIEDYVHAYHACADFPERSDLAIQTQALDLAIYFREQLDLPRMTKYLALAAMHFSKRESVGQNKKAASLDLALKDKHFVSFFMHFGYSIFLGSVIVDTTSTAIYVAPQSMKDEEAKALSHVLKTKPHVKLLDISNQHITDTGAKALADALCDHPAIQTLYVGGNKISDEGKNALTTACDAAGIASGRNIKIDLFFGEQRTKYSERPK